MLLAGDIGGTNCRLACFTREVSRLRLVAVADYPSNSYSCLEDVIARFLDQHWITDAVESAAFGIAGPVEDGVRVKTTNLPWVVDRGALCRSLKTDSIALLNDLVANAYGVCWLTTDDVYALNDGVAHPGSNRALISAGTGLGEAGLICVEGRYVAVQSEGGHRSLAPRNAIEIELLNFLRERFGHVSWERAVSGSGLVNIYEFFRSKNEASTSDVPLLEKSDPAAAISKAGMLGRDPTAKQALELFVTLYGAEAGNVALQFLSTDGLYLGGGIAPKILPKLKDGGFFDAFICKGRLSTLLGRTSVFVILNDRTALIGAALIAARQAGYDFEEPPTMEGD